MVARLRTYGAHSEEVPTISVEPPRSPLQMDKAIRGLVEGRYEWVAFTSVNAVKAVREKFEEYGLDARAFSGLKVAAVGEVTAQALQAWGIEPDLVPERRAVRRRPGRGVPAVRRRAGPDQPGLPAPGRHRHRDPGRGPAGARLGGRGRHRLPDGAGRPAAGPGPRGDQDRQVRRRRLHLLLDRAQPGRHRRQAAPADDHRGDRPGHGPDLRGARAAGRRRGGQAVSGRAGRRPGQLRRRPPGRVPGRAGEPVLRPSQKKPTPRAADLSVLVSHPSRSAGLRRRHSSRTEHPAFRGFEGVAPLGGSTRSLINPPTQPERSSDARRAGCDGENSTNADFSASVSGREGEHSTMVEFSPVEGGGRES